MKMRFLGLILLVRQVIRREDRKAHLGRMQTHDEQVDSLLQELSGKDQDKVGPVSILQRDPIHRHTSRHEHVERKTSRKQRAKQEVGKAYLGLLSLRGSDEQLSGRVDDLDLTDDSGSVGGDEEAGKMVDDELVSAWGSRQTDERKEGERRRISFGLV
jgi:hypothetical protein